MPQPDPVVFDLGVDRLALLVRGEEPEGDAPAQLGLALAGRHRDLDVIGMDGVLARQVPDLEAEWIGADAGLDPGVKSEGAPSPANPFLAGLPFLQHLQWAHPAANLHAAGIPTVEPAAERQLIHRSVEAGLVVDLVG